MAERESLPVPLPSRFLARSLAVAAAATTPIPTESAAPAATAAESALGLRPRFVDHQRPAVELVFVQLTDRSLRLFVRTHLDEREPACAAGRHISHHADAVDLASLAEQLGKLIFRRGVWKVADVEFPTHADT